MEDNEFYVRIWVMLVTVACVVAVSVTVYYSYKVHLLAESDSPMELSCAIDGDTSSLKQVCSTLSIIKGK
jgi:hypothetical protein